MAGGMTMKDFNISSLAVFSNFMVLGVAPAERT